MTLHAKTISLEQPLPIRGAGVDAKPERQPGVPMEIEPPRPAGNAHWDEPERQPDPGTVLKRQGLDELTPVFGTAAPPRGLSGLMRRAAYRIPEHHTTHWFALLAADRVDALEYRARKALPFALPAAALAAIALAFSRWRAG
jgi:hypothetical protein